MLNSGFEFRVSWTQTALISVGFEWVAYVPSEQTLKTHEILQHKSTMHDELPQSPSTVDLAHEPKNVPVPLQRQPDADKQHCPDPQHGGNERVP